MKTHNVLGHKIVEVRQERMSLDDGTHFYAVTYFQLDNGKLIVFHPEELPSDYAVSATVITPPKKNT